MMLPHSRWREHHKPKAEMKRLKPVRREKRQNVLAFISAGFWKISSCISKNKEGGFINSQLQNQHLVGAEECRSLGKEPVRAPVRHASPYCRASANV